MTSRARMGNLPEVRLRLRGVSLRTITDFSEISEIHQQIMHDIPSRMQLGGTIAEISFAVPTDTWSEEHFAIDYNDETVGVGTVKMFRWDRTASIAVEVIPEYQRRGVGVFASALMARYLFEVIGIWKLETFAYGFNPQSIRIQERYLHAEGIVRETMYAGGRYHDKHLFGLTRPEYDQLVETLGWW